MGLKAERVASQIQRELGDIILNEVKDNKIGFITITDLDSSIEEFNAFNDYSDNAYLVFKLPTGFTMQKYDKMTVKLYPAVGIVKILVLEAPMPMSSVVDI